METRAREIMIGDSIRLKGWTNCVLEVMDIGKYCFVGCLIDIKANRVVDPLYVAPIGTDWMLACSADDIIHG